MEQVSQKKQICVDYETNGRTFFICSFVHLEAFFNGTLKQFMLLFFTFNKAFGGNKTYIPFKNNSRCFSSSKKLFEFSCKNFNYNILTEKGINIMFHSFFVSIIIKNLILTDIAT